jgi:Uma2 family endonuclease
MYNTPNNKRTYEYESEETTMTNTDTLAVMEQPTIMDEYDDLSPPTDDPFFYGWREVLHTSNGTEEWIREPLTLDDVLHPQWGDYIMQNEEHFLVCNDLYDGLQQHLTHEHHTVLLHDTPINWEGEVKALCPDLAVIREVQRRFPKGTFYVRQSKGHVDMVLEVTSRSTRKVDVDGENPVNKVQKYAQVGVPYYIIVDDARRKEGYPPAITVYKLQEGKGYQRECADARGWYWLPSLALWIGPYQDWVSWYDEQENKIGTVVEVALAREQAETRAQQAEVQVRAEARAREQAEAQIEQLKALLRKAGLE